MNTCARCGALTMLPRICSTCEQADRSFTDYARARRWDQLGENRYSNPLWRMIRTQCEDGWGSDVIDDVFSAVLAKLGRRWDALLQGAIEMGKKDVPAAAIKKIVHDEIVDERRRRGRGVEIPYSPLGPDDNDSPATAHNPELFQESELERAAVAAGAVAPAVDAELDEPDWTPVRRALRALPEKQRVVIEMCDWGEEPLSVTEAAEKLNLSISAVERRRAAGRKALRDQLGPWLRAQRLDGQRRVTTGRSWQGNDASIGVTADVHAEVGCWVCGMDQSVLDGTTN